MSVYPPDVEVRRDATISSCGLYRYGLHRSWGDGSRLHFIMLNPSTADAELDDPTIRRCVSLARREGHDGIGVFNLYAFRATKPADLWAAAAAGVDVTGGQRNDDLLAEVWRQWKAQPVVAAWGAHARQDRVDQVLALPVLGALRGPLLCLGTTKAGAPRHPLMVRNDAPLVPWGQP